MDTKSSFYKVKSYSSNAAWPNVIEAAENYLRRLLSALLHGCRTQDPERVRNLLSPSMFYLHNEVF
jgi:hypothetical protein